jgi:hypothetical protein
VLDEEENRQVWKAWQEGLSRRITLSEQRDCSKIGKK